MEQPEKKIKTLKEFIEEYQKVLAVVGVFFALSFYFGKAELSSIAGFISFLFFASAVVLILEVYRGFDTKKSSWMLLVFINIFTPLIGYIVWYFLLVYRPFWKRQTSTVLFWIAIIPLWYLLRRLRVQTTVAGWIAKILAATLKLMSIRVNAKFHKITIKRIKRLEVSKEESIRLQDEANRENEESLRKFFENDELTAAKDSKIVANVLVGIVLFIGCNLVADKLGLIINPRLDKVYETYKASEQSPTPTPASAPSPSPILSVVPSPSPISTAEVQATPSITPQRLGNKRR